MKLSKVLSIIVVAMVLIASTSNFVYAKKASLTNPADITGTYENTSGITTVGKSIIGIIQTAGSVLSVAILVVLGVKYMMGSTEEKAEYKKTMIPYVIGAILIFAASNIAGIIFTWAGSVGSGAV